jgi:hypothetical protein
MRWRKPMCRTRVFTVPLLSDMPPQLLLDAVASTSCTAHTTKLG